MFDPNSYLSFTEILHGPTADHNKYSLPEIAKEEEKPVVEAAATVEGGEAPATPNSSTTTSTEAAGEEYSNKGKKESQDQDQDTSKNEAKVKKKVEKKEKQARFAFMTKSEVDHLEDGYRWRKYGQKAVKNSPYPRSYYRCTTQKCGVKKRVERSFEDPSIVITTYEGQHSHHVPANLRGHVAGMFASPMFAPPLMPFEAGGPNFSQQLMAQMPHIYGYDGANSNNLYHQRTLTPPRHQHFQQFPDYGLLQDIIPPVFPKQEN
ncbi:probable WRKY transcription factor 71 [Phtheirospermum japonicum]|uniref:Probable WRKY transcription factor 71 n=1 Tax=Phtheirospermum japonicum TaxID=374723 RepID=A0A830C5J2_9LAMI|nr:probable WRKY transcription factor 71 [Phtheirospermum japonicum]